MIYVTRYQACLTCKHKYTMRDEEPCSECCHGKDDLYEKEGEPNEDS